MRYILCKENLTREYLEVVGPKIQWLFETKLRIVIGLRKRTHKNIFMKEENEMNVSDVEALKNWLSRQGDLNSANSDLIENAIWCLENGNSYRAESSLKTLAANLRNEGQTESAKAVERLL